MKKFPFFIIIALILILAFTNTSKAEYIDWVSNKLKDSAGSENALVTLGIDLLGSSLISSATEEKDFIIGSIYTTTYQDKELKVLGIFNTFIPLSNNLKNLDLNK